MGSPMFMVMGPVGWGGAGFCCSAQAVANMVSVITATIKTEGILCHFFIEFPNLPYLLLQTVAGKLLLAYAASF